MYFRSTWVQGEAQGVKITAATIQLKPWPFFTCNLGCCIEVFFPICQCPRYITFVFITHFCIVSSSIHSWPYLYFTANLNNPFSLHSVYIFLYSWHNKLTFSYNTVSRRTLLFKAIFAYFNNYSFFTIACTLCVIFLPPFICAFVFPSSVNILPKSAICLFFYRLYKTCVNSFIPFYLSNTNTLSFDSWIFRFMFLTTSHNISNICCKSFMLPGKITASFAYRNTHLYLSQSTNLKEHYENSYKYIYKYIMTSPPSQHTFLSYSLRNIFHISHVCLNFTNPKYIYFLFFISFVNLCLFHSFLLLSSCSLLYILTDTKGAHRIWPLLPIIALIN